MTSDQYRTAIKALGLSQERAGEMLGIAPRTSQGYALGEYPVSEPVAKLLEAYDYIKRLEDDLRDCQEFLRPHRGMDPYSMFSWTVEIDPKTGPSPNYASRLYKAIEETLSESQAVYQPGSYPRRRRAGDVP